MGYSRFEFEIDITLRRAALPALLDEAQARGYGRGSAGEVPIAIPHLHYAMRRPHVR